MFEGLFQPTHLILILVIALIVLGPGKLPEVSRGLGKSIREFKKATSGLADDITEPIKEAAQPITDMKQQVDSIRRLPAETLASVTSSPEARNGTAPAGAPAETAAAVASAGTKACPVCAHANPAGNHFCGGCGAKLD